ncbi:MAG: HAMP domain-containing histidine kinase [Spirochaetaceae bacterium]|nr:HAMP domain-containing histidine kinase [Myxococcales bacterium]MCB9723778.1 HAMP domain-containing histidine kinase [Spirochaetaceae bacterium]
MFATIRSLLEPPISADPEQSTAKLAWVVRLRWVAIAAQLLSIVPALHFDLLGAEMLPLFGAVVATLAVLNVGTWIGLRRGTKGTPAQLLVQLTADILGLSALLILTGGAWNPLVPILLVHSVLGALLLEGRLGLAFFGLLLGCLLLIQFNSHIPPGLAGTLVPREILFPAQILVILVFWILTAWLSRTLDSLKIWFADAQQRKTRIDRLRAVGALAAGLSHEFATPLNTAQLRLKRLARRHELEGDEDLATAIEELERCGDILRHMAGSQLQPDRLSLEVVDLDALVRQVCASVSGVHEEATIRVLGDGRGPKRVLLPTVAFSQALINLVDNSIESGGPDGEIEIVVQRTGSRAELSVQDRGSGWPDVVRRHLGEPFVTTKPEGVGLGLYYVHSLAQAIGADLTLADREFGGAVARISLPLVPAGGAAESGDPMYVQAPDWRPQNG